eukprot:Gb_20469 [translate_table: standard]
MDDNLRTEIALSIEEAIRRPLEEIRVAMGEMVQSIRSLHVANERTGQGDKSSDEEEGRRRLRDRRREANQHDHEQNPFARNFDGRRVDHRNQGNQENQEGNHINQRGYVKALKPATLEEAIQYAECYSEVAKSRFTIGTSSKTSQTSKSIVNSNVSPTSTAGQFKSRMVDPAIIVDLCSKGLCFNCKEKWSKGHKRKTPGKIHIIEILNEEHPKMAESDQGELVGAEEEIANINEP